MASSAAAVRIDISTAWEAVLQGDASKEHRDRLKLRADLKLRLNGVLMVRIEWYWTSRSQLKITKGEESHVVYRCG